jgi:hypothetical protein
VTQSGVLVATCTTALTSAAFNGAIPETPALNKRGRAETFRTWLAVGSVDFLLKYPG